MTASPTFVLPPDQGSNSLCSFNIRFINTSYPDAAVAAATLQGPSVLQALLKPISPWMAQLPQPSYVNILGVRVGSSLGFPAADDVFFATKRVN